MRQCLPTRTPSYKQMVVKSDYFRFKWVMLVHLIERYACVRSHNLNMTPVLRIRPLPKEDQVKGYCIYKGISFEDSISVYTAQHKRSAWKPLHDRKRWKCTTGAILAVVLNIAFACVCGFSLLPNNYNYLCQMTVMERHQYVCLTWIRTLIYVNGCLKLWRRFDGETKGNAVLGLATQLRQTSSEVNTTRKHERAVILMCTLYLYKHFNCNRLSFRCKFQKSYVEFITTATETGYQNM